MSSLGTFAGFTTARLGIYASQIGLNVTGNNISNINTAGYTRQRLDQISLSGGASGRYHSQYDVRVGMGPLCTGVSQIRDPYLDIRYRTESSSVGYLDSMLSGLESLKGILDEVADGGDEKNGVVEAQLMDLLNSLNALAAQPGNTNEKLVRLAADTLVKQLNSYANRLEQVRKDTENQLNGDLDTVNSLLERIRDLNDSIFKSDIHGDNALEKRDERNRLIDELSQYIKIEVDYSMADVGGGSSVEKLIIRLGNANPDGAVNTDSAVLVDGGYATRLSIAQIPMPNPLYEAGSTSGDSQYQYLEPDGTGTNDPSAAAKIDSPNYDISLAALRDAKDRVMSTFISSAQTQVNELDAQTAMAQAGYGEPVFDPVTGLETTTTYIHELQADNTSIWYKSEVVKQRSIDISLDDNDLYGALQATRELLTEAGEFSSDDTVADVDESARSKRGIPYYQKSLDLFARSLAEAFNNANKGNLVNADGHYVHEDGSEIIVNGVSFGPNDNLDAAQIAALDAAAVGGNLFSSRGNSNDGEDITAANISISQDWSTGAVHIVNSFSYGAGSTAQNNIVHMVALLTGKRDFAPSQLGADSTQAMFNGTFAEMFGNIGTDLGKDIRSTQTMLTTSYGTQVELDASRDAVSGVDLNDEAANLMQYSKSYSAACRLMTTLDEALDKLINGTGVVGR